MGQTGKIGRKGGGRGKSGCAAAQRPLALKREEFLIHKRGGWGRKKRGRGSVSVIGMETTL